MNTAKKLALEPNLWPHNKDEYYAQLTTRNAHFVTASTQQKLRELRILVAGCGSTGGACIEPLARLGIENFILADNGTYELNNLNRQHAFKEDLGHNKALVHAQNLQGINPFIKLQCFAEGLSPQNSDHCVSWADLIIDAIDVTSVSGIKMKLHLHEKAHAHHKTVLTALDIGFKQWGRTYDYRNTQLEIFDGAYEKAKAANHPLKVLFSIVPLAILPGHALALAEDLLTRQDVSASQIGCASDLLSAIIAPVLIRYAETGEAVSGWDVDLYALAKPWRVRFLESLRYYSARRRVKKLLEKVP